MVKNMQKVINSNDPKHKKLVTDAFGQNPNTAEIKGTITKLDTGTFKIGNTAPDAQADPRFVASVPFGKATGEPKSAKLGPEFFCKPIR
jgi:hypothetical protein